MGKICSTVLSGLLVISLNSAVFAVEDGKLVVIADLGDISSSVAGKQKFKHTVRIVEAEENATKTKVKNKANAAKAGARAAKAKKVKADAKAAETKNEANAEAAMNAALIQ